MKRSVSIFLSLTLTFAAFSQSWTRPEDATKHVGDVVKVVGFVKDIITATDEQGSQTFLKLAGKDSTHSLTLVFQSGTRLRSQEALESAYLHRYVQVQGRVDTYKGKPRINLQSEKQITIAKEADLMELEPQ